MSEDQDNCYVCMGPESQEEPFANPNPCDCKGSIKLHSSCAQQVMAMSSSCGICKNLWKFTGIRRNVYGNKLHSEVPYVNGLVNGLLKTYSIIDGSLSNEMPYVNNIPHGLYKLYDNTGICLVECMYANGKRNGIYKNYYPNGRLKEEGTHYNEFKDGISKEYNINGWLLYERIWAGGFQHGIEKAYNPDGTVKYESMWINGVLAQP